MYHLLNRVQSRSMTDRFRNGSCPPLVLNLTKGLGLTRISGARHVGPFNLRVRAFTLGNMPAIKHS